MALESVGVDTESTDTPSMDGTLTDPERDQKWLPSYTRVSAPASRPSSTNALKLRRPASSLIKSSGTRASPASAPISPNDLKVAAYSTCSAAVTRWSCAGSIDLAETTRTFAIRYVNSCGGALSSVL